MKTLIADIEGNGLLPELTDIWQISIKEIGNADVESYHGDKLAEGLDRLRRPGQRVVFHHGTGYDIPAILQVLGVDLTVDGPDLVDTLVLSRLGNPERTGGHSLAAWGDTLGFPKVDHDDWSKWSHEMEHRCNVDVLITEKVFTVLEPMLDKMPVAVAIEHATADEVFHMCRRGIHFNEMQGQRLLMDLLTERDTAREAADAVLPLRYFEVGHKCLQRDANKAHWGHGAIHGGVEWTEVKSRYLQVGSRDDIRLYLKETYGWKGTEKTKTGKPKITDDILRDLPWSEAQAFANFYKVDKLISYLDGEINKSGKGGGWLKHVTKEGKLHAGFIPLTAVTGRPSCVAPNLQQVSTDPRARCLFSSRPRWKLVGIDADGQELRCLGHYLHPFDGGAYANEVVNGDIHELVRKLIGFNDRDITKRVEYGLIYGAGNPRLGTIAAVDAISAGKPVPKNFGKRGGEIRRAIMSGITGFKDLDDAVKKRAKRLGKLRGIDGRTLWVRSPHSALNLLLQSCGIIVMKRAMLLMPAAFAKAGLIEDEHYGMVLWVHDEFQFEAHPDQTELVGQTVAGCITQAALDLGVRTPMSASYKIGNTWKDTH